MPIDPNAPQTPWEAKQIVTEIYRSRGLILPANLDVLARRLYNTEGALLNTIVGHANRNAANPGQLEEFNRTYSREGGTTPITDPAFTSPGQLSPGADAVIPDDGIPDDGPDLDAKARLEDLLAGFGLEALADWAWSMLVAGHSEITISQELRKQPEFKERFPAIAERAAAGLPALSPADYVAYERDARQLFQRWGLPPTFYDEPSDYHDLLVKDVSIQELGARIERGFSRVQQSPPEVRREFDEMFGASGDAALATFFLDGDRALPALERAVATAEMSGAGAIAGFDVGRGTADRLASFGFTFGAAMQNFQSAAQLRPLSQELSLERTDVTEDDLIGGSFGIDADAAERLRKRGEGRVAPFASGDTGRVGQEGLLGAGRAKT